jgi:intracellular sulfur oxidation DsrE/DsrF family protein
MSLDTKFVLGVIMACMLAGAAGAVPPTQRVVYHIDSADAEQQRAALRTVGNHLNELGHEQVDARIVIHGNGVSMLLPSGTRVGRLEGSGGDVTRTRLEDLAIRGVQFQVCRNSLQRREVDETYPLLDLDSKEVVESGIAEIVRLQQAGFTYIKL